MTVLLATLIPIAAAGGWWAGWRYHAPLREDRRWLEDESWTRGDATWALTGQLDRRGAALRYLARLPQPRRVKVMSRYCRLVKEMTP